MVCSMSENKGRRGGTGANQHKQKGHSDPSAKQLAEQHKVGEKTIRRDAQFSRAVDAVAKAGGNGAKTALLVKRLTR